MQIRVLIKALGGPTEVATALGLRIATVSNWSMRDQIPRDHHLAVWRLAIDEGIDWTPPGGDGLTLVPATAVTPPSKPKPKPRPKRPLPAPTPLPSPHCDEAA